MALEQSLKSVFARYIGLRSGLYFCLIMACVIFPSLARAEIVAHELRGLELSGNLEIAEGKSLEKDGVALIVHGTIGHHRMEIIETLQRNLLSRGINSLAVTFSMGLDARQGEYPCKLEHDHRHMDGVEEIGSWVSWLRIAGARKITLIGHSRGGNQAALFMGLHEVTKAGGLNAPAAQNIENYSIPDLNKGEGAWAAQGVVKIKYGNSYPAPDPIVKNLILLAPMSWTYEKARRTYSRRHKKLLGPLLKAAKKRAADFEGMMLIEDIGFLKCRKARVTVDAFVDYYAPNPYYFTPNILPYIKANTLVLAAGNDQVNTDLSAAMSSFPYQKNTEFQTVRDADHIFSGPSGVELSDKISAFMMRAQ